MDHSREARQAGQAPGRQSENHAMCRTQETEADEVDRQGEAVQIVGSDRLSQALMTPRSDTVFGALPSLALCRTPGGFRLHLTPELLVGNTTRFFDLTARLIEQCPELG
jgi:hypothetical protein